MASLPFLAPRVEGRGEIFHHSFDHLVLKGRKLARPQIISSRILDIFDNHKGLGQQKISFFLALHITGDKADWQTDLE